jgi:large subunit ribosomal protein L10
VVFTTVSKVKVSEIETVREELFKGGLQLQVAKNSILRRALQQSGVEVPDELLDQPLALVYGYDDVIAAPKAVTQLAKGIEPFEALGGIMDGRFLTAAEVSQLASLPSREQLYGQVVNVLAAPMSGLVTVLSGTMRGLVTALSQVAEKKQEAAA